MQFFERHLPLVRMILNGIRARALTPHMLTSGREIRAAQASASSADDTPIEPDSIPDSAVLQIRLYQDKQLHFKKIDGDLDGVELAENEVLFVPKSIIVNKYILFYNSVYLPMDIGSFLDPRQTMNSRFLKIIPAWSVCYVHRSNHPAIEEGSSYHGFFPLAPYSIRRVGDVDKEEGTAVQSVPAFKGPLEWLRLVRTDGHQDFIADFFEYFKIGLTFAAQLRDLDYYGAEQLLVSSASSTSAQIIAMCLKEIKPDFTIVGFTSPRNYEMAKGFPYFDEVYTYDDLTSGAGHKPGLYFDALGDESISVATLKHFQIRRWWIYAQGGEKALSRLLKINLRGSQYSNGIDSYMYANRMGISDSYILGHAEAMNQKYDLDRRWGSGYRTISSPRELYDIYNAFISNTLPSGERVRYVSPLLRHG